MEGLFVKQIGIYKSTNAKIIACLSAIIADQLWTWNIISLFEHSAPSALSTSPCVPCLGRLSILGGWPVSLLMGISLKGGFSPLSNQEVSPVTSTWFCSAARLSGFPTHGLASAQLLVKSGQLGTWLTSINFKTTHLSQSPPTFCATLSGLGTLSLSSSHLRPLQANIRPSITQTVTPRLPLLAIHHCIFDMPPTNPVNPLQGIRFKF
jgi:hypothetical protein